MTIPTMFTLFRISLIPIFFVLFYLPFQWSYLASAMIFAIAGITDWLDGFLARKLDQSSHLGAFLDPVADKLVVAVALVLLVGEHAKALLALPAAIIVCREILVSALRERMAQVGQGQKLKVSWIGKFKTTAQFVAILILLANPAQPFTWWVLLGYVLLYIAVMLTLWSLWRYFKASWRDLL